MKERWETEQKKHMEYLKQIMKDLLNESRHLPVHTNHPDDYLVFGLWIKKSKNWRDIIFSSSWDHKNNPLGKLRDREKILGNFQKLNYSSNDHAVHYHVWFLPKSKYVLYEVRYLTLSVNFRPWVTSIDLETLIVPDCPESES